MLLQRQNCMQSIPLAVLKLNRLRDEEDFGIELHAIHTACGIETTVIGCSSKPLNRLHAIHTACGIETQHIQILSEHA